MTNQAISDAFVSARLSARALPGFPGDLPGSLSEAYAVQALSVAAWPDEVAGWKVGGIPPANAEKYGADRLAGPIFKRSVRRVNGAPVSMPAFEGGFAAVESEYVLVTGDAVEPGAVAADALAARNIVARVHIGVEIASSPLRTINELGPASIISDFGNNAGIILGEEIEDWRDRDLSEIEVETLIDGDTVGTARAGPDAPFEAVAFLIGHFARADRVLPAGTYVSTGAITGVHDAQVGAVATARFEGVGRIDLRLDPAQAAGSSG